MKELIAFLEERFNANKHRHRDVTWSQVEERLKAFPKKVKILEMLEQSGGEPDVVSRDTKTGVLLFVDCSKESPSGRRSLCYDLEGLNARKENKPEGAAVEWASKIGAELLNETEYRQLQALEKFDTKTSSWILTPAPIRKLGGALFADFRYGQVFIYHNSAPSYYAARGFRCKVGV